MKTAGQRPSDIRYSVFVERGHAVDGRWRIGLGRYTGDGFPLWSGHSEEVVTDLPANSALRFGFAGTAALNEGEQLTSAVTLLVLLDGKQIFESKETVRLAPQASRYCIPLPVEARPSARFRFEVEGGAAICAVLDPVVGPADVGRSGALPFLPKGQPQQPSILLFLADTFRADNMKAYGAKFQKSITPNLDKFTKSSILFERVWSPGSWTLPSQTSMMTGLFPHQHGVDRGRRCISEEITTMAEVFTEAGYRTGAITDAIIVSSKFGFDYGFQWFDESPDGLSKSEELNRTLSETKAFLDADDGRPFFLFVQTYRVHDPYFVTDETRREYATELNIQEDWKAIYRSIFGDVKLGDTVSIRSEGVDAAADPLGRLYRGGVVDLDRGFGRFLRDFDRRGLDETAWIVFASDHGESLGEHETFRHGNGVWEANVRVPLVMRGPAREALRIKSAASLVDLPRTLVGIAGIEPAPSWGGRDLLKQPSDGPMYSFESPGRRFPEMAAIIEGSRKIIVRTEQAGEPYSILSAYDHKTDPNEERDLVLQKAAWPAKLFKQHESEFDSLCQPVFSTAKVRLGAKDIAELSALGYTDTEEE